MSSSAAIVNVIRQRAINRRMSERLQLDLVRDDLLFQETIRAKLFGLWESNQYWNLCRCGEEDIYRTCRDCGAVEKFRYRCSLKWCPVCQWRATERRKELIWLWASKLAQPKHLVLTQANFPILTPRKIHTFGKNLVRLRRSKVMSSVNGGTVSIEITNSGRGWHLHAHCLLDVKWLDMAEVSRRWGRIVGQEFAVVKISDCRGRDYLREVCKYVVEGSEMAKWPAEQILEFVTAVKGRRFFFTFGSLRKLAPAIRAELAASGPEAPECDCGSSDFVFQTETQAIVSEIKQMERRR